MTDSQFGNQPSFRSNPLGSPHNTPSGQLPVRRNPAHNLTAEEREGLSLYQQSGGAHPLHASGISQLPVIPVGGDVQPKVVPTGDLQSLLKMRLTGF